jgi:hypothetical protein
VTWLAPRPVFVVKDKLVHSGYIHCQFLSYLELDVKAVTGPYSETLHLVNAFFCLQFVADSGEETAEAEPES